MRRELLRVAAHRRDGMAPRQRLREQPRADPAGGADQCDFHGVRLPFQATACPLRLAGATGLSPHPVACISKRLTLAIHRCPGSCRTATEKAQHATRLPQGTGGESNIAPSRRAPQLRTFPGAASAPGARRCRWLRSRSTWSTAGARRRTARSSPSPAAWPARRSRRCSTSPPPSPARISAACRADCERCRPQPACRPGAPVNPICRACCGCRG